MSLAFFIWYLIGLTGSVGLSLYTYYTGDDIRAKDIIGFILGGILGPLWTLIVFCFIVSDANFLSKVVIKGKVK